MKQVIIFQPEHFYISLRVSPSHIYIYIYSLLYIPAQYPPAGGYSSIKFLTFCSVMREATKCRERNPRGGESQGRATRTVISTVQLLRVKRLIKPLFYFSRSPLTFYPFEMD